MLQRARRNLAIFLRAVAAAGSEPDASRIRHRCGRALGGGV